VGLESFLALQQDRCRGLSCSGGRVGRFGHSGTGVRVCESILVELKNSRLIEQRLNSLAGVKAAATHKQRQAAEAEIAREVLL